MTAEKLVEYTNASHIYMKMFIDGRIEEIDVYMDRYGSPTYKTTADHADPHRRQPIIDAFNELY